MKPGIYRNMPEKLYRAIPAINQSALKYPTPLHMRHAMDNPSEQTPAMLFGRLTHLMALEPGQARAQYTVMPDLTGGIKTKGGEPAKNPRGTTVYKEREAAWRAENQGLEIVDSEVWHGAARAAHAVRQHEDALHFIEASDNSEIVAVWKDRTTGLLCKARLDAISDVLSVVTDLKTCKSADPHEFASSVFNFGYHIQAAHYLNGARACGFDVHHFAIVAVERDAPHAVQVFELEGEAIDYGQIVLRDKMRQYAEAQSSGKWPGYPDGITPITLPAWAWTRIRKEQQEWTT